jgi:4-amino-4-deoxy-L-arabinose transferase-like glycosyltransferase
MIRSGRRPLAAFEWLIGALVDPARRERAMALFLLFYLAVWSLYGAIAKGSQDIHFDMGEMVAWSREAGIGTPKHPPLAAWLVRGWFSVFPLADWDYYLFAMVMATLSLWIAWRVSARYLDGEKRVAGVMLLTLVPFYNFHALKFNANTVLMPLWAAAAWWFLRSFETRRAGWAILAGAGAAAAMLGKYWSVTLLAGLGVAALCDARRAAYFRSSAPWLTIAVGAVLIAPHVAWIVTHHFVPFDYALDTHPATLLTATMSAAGFLAGVVGYCAVPIVFTLLVASPGAAGIRDTLWPASAERRILVIAFAAPLILAPLSAVLLRVEVVSLWAMSAMTLLPVVLLSSPLVTLSQRATAGLLAVAIMFPLAMAAISPVIAIVIHHRGVTHYATHYRLIAQAIERAWREHTDQPLRIVGSDTNVVNGAVFYLSDKPSTFDIMNPDQTPWVDENRIARQGIALVCPMPEARCVRVLNARVSRGAGAAAVSEVSIASTYLGHIDDAVRYVIAIIPPQPPARP